MKVSQISVLILVFSSLVSANANAADIEAGKAKSAVCAACHGADGNSANAAWPSLAGQHASYTYKQLKDFKAGRRNNASMTGMVALLNDDDMKNLAAFYESQQPKAVAFDGEMIEKGEGIYRGGITETHVAACMGCHAPNGAGNGPAGWPSLKGQHPEYVVTQLQNFKQGLRANDTGKMMRNIVVRMSDSEMQAVAAYIAGIQ
ncbi:MAG: cytochrome c4 [Gammaproteobacteria bacterium]|nr:cytochrome c4 [Gammaproteobacteria bacterium]MDH3857318.1 cytochrome c4 [Gammaproteobacteria bacterium]